MNKDLCRRSLLYLLLLMLFSACSKQKADPSERMLRAEDVTRDVEIFHRVLAAAHPSLNLYISKERLKVISDSVFNSGKDEMSVRELFKKLSLIIDRIGCAHSGLYLSDEAYDTLNKRSFFFPLPVSWVENKLLINATGYTIPYGTELVAVNGEPVREILKKLSAYETPEGLQRAPEWENCAADFGFHYFMHFGPAKQFTLLLRDSTSAESSLTADAITLQEMNRRESEERYYSDNTDVPYDFEIIDDDAYALLRMSTFTFAEGKAQIAFGHFCDNSFALLQARPDIKHLIIDVRSNPGGNINHAAYLFTYLTAESFRDYDRAVSRIQRIPFTEYLSNMSDSEIEEQNEWLSSSFSPQPGGGYRLADSLIDRWDRQSNVFEGKVYVLTDHFTASAGSYFAAMIKYSGRGKVVGTPAFGGNFSGNANARLTYRLPASDIEVFFPLTHIVYQYRAPRSTGRTLAPDYFVPDNEESFRKNSDRQIRYVRDSLIFTGK